MSNQPYKNARSFLTNENPERYNFESEFGLTKENTFERYFTYRAASYRFRNKAVKKASNRLYSKAVDFCDSMRENYTGIFDLDGTDGKCELVKDIYRILWDWNTDDSYENFRKINYFGTLFGGDTANSVQTILNYCTKEIVANTTNYSDEEREDDYSFLRCLQLYRGEKGNNYISDLQTKFDELEDYIDIYHIIGNFILVPAYFNPFKGGFAHKGEKHLHDFMDEGLCWLKKEGWNVAGELAKNVKIRRYKPENLRKYLVNISQKNACQIPDIDEKIGQNMPDKKVEDIRNYIAKMAENRYRSFSKNDFNKYINTMFLWDYTLTNKDFDNIYKVKSLCKNKWSNQGKQEEYDEKAECRSSQMKVDEIENYISNAKFSIERRSHFMVAMLRIALLDSDGKNVKPRDPYNGEYCDMWGDWDVSLIYKEIMYKVFLQEDKVFSGYEEVIVEIEAIINKANIDCKDILKDLKEKLGIKQIE